jgi:hypothetical protein
LAGAHPHIIVGAALAKNPVYVPPDDFLTTNPVYVPPDDFLTTLMNRAPHDGSEPLI